MLIPMAYNSHQVRSVHTIEINNINMMLHTVYTMFVELKTGCETIFRQHSKNRFRVPALKTVDSVLIKPLFKLEFFR